MNDLKMFSSSAYKRVLFPGSIFAFSLFLLAIVWVTMTSQNPNWKNILFFIGLAGGLYGVILGLFFSTDDVSLFSKPVAWIHIAIVGVSLGLVASLASLELLFIAYVLFVLNMISATLIFSVRQVHVLILIAFFVHLHGHFEASRVGNVVDWFHLVSFPVLAVIVAETVHRFRNAIAHNLKRMNMVNMIFRKLSSSLDEDEVHTWVKEAIQDAFDADTYYLALVNGDYLDLGLFYDDGRYYHAVQIALAGTLGGWAIRHDQTLFLNDLRTEPELEGVKRRIVGKEKTSLSWLGVPFKTEYVAGMIGIASYSPLAFTQEDVDLLESLTQQVALALNNARQHKLVTLQARTDSLTQVYNHGYFLTRLQEDLALAREDNMPLSLIMLDVDFFKKYNDTYGHLVGDEVLVLMVKTIQRFIKERDSIGRWGGEEFAICLPQTSLQEAQIVAVRIQETLENMQISVLEHEDIPVPTVSQGVAEFPKEADEAFKLVDLADGRLYTAKGRGRNQIEPRLDIRKEKRLV